MRRRRSFIHPNVPNPSKPGRNPKRCPCCRGVFDESEFANNGKGRTSSAKPTGEANSAPHGVLAEKAANMLMQVLHAARYARFDLLCAVAKLAQHISTWGEECRKTIYRLMCYIHSTLHWRQMGNVSNTLIDTNLHLYAEADLAGDASQRFTSGMQLVKGAAVLTSRSHSISVAFLKDSFGRADITLQYCQSDRQAADVYTQAFLEADKWEHVARLIGVGGPTVLPFASAVYFWASPLRPRRRCGLRRPLRRGWGVTARPPRVQTCVRRPRGLRSIPKPPPQVRGRLRVTVRPPRPRPAPVGPRFRPCPPPSRERGAIPTRV